jgi:hypothetical protein
VAAEGFYGVVVEAGFVQEGAGLGGFGFEGQLLASSSSRQLETVDTE